MSRIPVRTCVSCRRARPRDELVRVVKAPDGAVTLDERAVRPGRGAYVCRDITCIETATTDDARRLRRALRTDAGAGGLDDLHDDLHDLYDQLKTASAS